MALAQPLPLKLPEELGTTPDGKHIYPFPFVVNRRELSYLYIDYPHYQEGHSSYMNDEKIYNITWESSIFGSSELEKINKGWEYYSYQTWIDQTAYKMIWCWPEEGSNFLGVVTCYHYPKEDKKTKK